MRVLDGVVAVFWRCRRSSPSRKRVWRRPIATKCAPRVRQQDGTHGANFSVYDQIQESPEGQSCPNSSLPIGAEATSRESSIGAVRSAIILPPMIGTTSSRENIPRELQKEVALWRAT